MLGYVVPINLTLKAGAGIHMWNLQLKRFSRVLYVRCRSTATNCPLNIRLVVQHYYDSLWSYDFLHKTLYTSPVQQDFHAPRGRKFAHGVCNPDMYLHHFYILHDNDVLHDLPMHSTRKDLEPTGDRWVLL